MNSPLLYAFCAAALIGIGLYGLIAGTSLLRRILGFNLLGSAIFLFFGSISALGGGGIADPVPQAMIITGIVVAIATTALALALIIRLYEETGEITLPGEESDVDDAR